MYYAQGSYRKKPAYNDNAKTRFQNRICAYGTAAFACIKIRHDLSPKAAVSIREVLRHPVHPLSLVISRAPAQALLRDRALQIAQAGALRVAGIGYVREVEGTQRAAPPLRQKHLARVGLFLPREQLPCLSLASACFYRYYTGKPTPAQPQTPKPVGSTSAGLSAFTHPAPAAPAPASPAPAFRCAIHSCG